MLLPKVRSHSSCRSLSAASRGSTLQSTQALSSSPRVAGGVPSITAKMGSKAPTVTFDRRSSGGCCDSTRLSPCRSSNHKAAFWMCSIFLSQFSGFCARVLRLVLSLK